jgi:hypothetical protein
MKFLRPLVGFTKLTTKGIQTQEKPQAQQNNGRHRGISGTVEKHGYKIQKKIINVSTVL